MYAWTWRLIDSPFSTAEKGIFQPNKHNSDPFKQYISHIEHVCCLMSVFSMTQEYRFVLLFDRASIRIVSQASCADPLRVVPIKIALYLRG